MGPRVDPETMAAVKRLGDEAERGGGYWTAIQDVVALLAVEQAAPKGNRFDCATCGQGIAVDEDGCCRTCGADAVPVLTAAVREPAPQDCNCHSGFSVDPEHECPTGTLERDQRMEHVGRLFLEDERELNRLAAQGSQTPPGHTGRIRVYVTAPYPLRDVADRSKQVLEAAGMVSTARWVTQDPVPPMGHDQAAMDLEDLRQADVLLALNPEGWGEKGTGGRHVELGWALATGTRVVLVGERTNVFHYLEEIVVVPDMAMAVKAIQGLGLPHE